MASKIIFVKSQLVDDLEIWFLRLVLCFWGQGINFWHFLFSSKTRWPMKSKMAAKKMLKIEIQCLFNAHIHLRLGTICYITILLQLLKNHYGHVTSLFPHWHITRHKNWISKWSTNFLNPYRVKGENDIWLTFLLITFER